MTLKEEIQKLKKEKNAVIMAHYYVPDEVQEIADYIGDSYYLSKVANTIQESVIVFCGVKFMGESAKILNPEKKVLMPDMSADCPMAHMVDIDRIHKIRSEYEDIAVVCYINSTAEIKTYADVCVTSANAVKIVKALPEKNIFFIPDGNLGRYVMEQVPEKNIILGDGYCPIHQAMSLENLERAIADHPGAKVLVHPECPGAIVHKADYVGSTSGIIHYAKESSSSEFIVGTEEGVFYELRKENPKKRFYPVQPHQTCVDMKKITLEKVKEVLIHENHEVHVSAECIEKTKRPLNRMLEFAK